jgi:hypothetical protein
MNPGSVAMVDPLLKQLAEWSEEMNFEQVDRAPEDRLNRVLWHAIRGSQVPYPEWAVGIDADEIDVADEEQEGKGAKKRAQDGPQGLIDGTANKKPSRERGFLFFLRLSPVKTILLLLLAGILLLDATLSIFCE